MKPSVCLKCGCSDIRRSKRHGPLEWILKRFFIVPCRCMVCYNRFFRPHFGRILFTGREIPKLWRLWVTFRAALRSLSLFAILCFAIAHSSPAYNQPDVLKLWAAPKTIRNGGLSSGKCNSAVQSLSCSSKAQARSANRMYFPELPVLLWSEADVTLRPSMTACSNGDLSDLQSPIKRFDF